MNIQCPPKPPWKAWATNLGKSYSDIKSLQAFIQQTIYEFYPLWSPNFGGVPTAPTALPGSSTTQLATTEFVMEAINKIGEAGVLTFNARSGMVSLQWSDVEGVGGAPTNQPTFTGDMTAEDIHADDIHCRNIDVSDDADIIGHAVVRGNFEVGGDATFEGDVEIKGDLNTADLFAAGDEIVQGYLSVADNLRVGALSGPAVIGSGRVNVSNGYLINGVPTDPIQINDDVADPALPPVGIERLGTVINKLRSNVKSLQELMANLPDPGEEVHVGEWIDGRPIYQLVMFRQACRDGNIRYMTVDAAPDREPRAVSDIWTMMVERSSVAYPDENLDTDGVTVLPINAVPLGRSLYYPVVRAGIVDPASPDPQDPDLILKQNIIRPPADPGFVWQDIPTPNRFNIHWDLPASVPDYIYMMLDYTLIYLRSPVNNFRHYDSVDRVPFNGIHWNALIVERTDSGRSFASNWVLTNFEEWKRVFGTDHYLVVRYLRDPPPP